MNIRDFFSGRCKCKGLLAAVAFSCSFIASAQSEVEKLKQQADDFSQNHPQEKIFLHTDKSFYLPGEIIWLKAYVVDARFNVPVDLSKVAYIEVLDKNNVPVLQTKIELANGAGNGSFLVPVSISSGNFLLRAYTRWMRNYGENVYFEKPITIVNTLKTLLPEPAVALKYSIHFFPEGGNLVQGITSKVAFTITDQFGNGMVGNGSIRNQKNDTVVALKTFRSGAGFFYLTPKSGDSYQAFITVKKDSVISEALPAAFDAGYVMKLEDQGENLKIEITVANKANEQFVYLLSQTRQKINHAEQKTLTGNTAAFTLRKSDLPPGVSTFTVFNALRQPVSERLYFKKPDLSQLQVKTDGASYPTRSKVALDIATLEKSEADEVTDLSVSVYKTDSLQAVDEFDIAGYFWLGSELAGHPGSTGEYLKNTGATADSSIDLLLLTRGWRRFKWEEIFSGKKPSFEFIPEYEGHIIAGKVFNKQSGLPESDIMGYLSAPSRQYQFAGGISNSKGEIFFNTKNFRGSDQIIVQTGNKTSRIDILNPYSEVYSASSLPAYVPSPAIQTQLLYHSINSQVQTTFLNDSLNRFYYPFKDSSHFYGPPEISYRLDDYVRFSTMEDVLREYVTEVAPRKQNKKIHLFLLKNPHELFTEDPLVLVDGVPFFDMDSVMAVDPLKIQKIEIMGRTFHAGVVSSSGIMSLSTYKGDLDGIRLDPNAVVLEYEGLQLQREFYSPVYENSAQKNSHAPDFRNVLYWAPELKFQGDKKNALSFYTSDIEGHYFIRVQGVSSKGRIFSETAGFEVKK